MITVDSKHFDVKVGEILLPEPAVIPFRSNSAPGIGIQVTSDRGPAFTLTLTRHEAQGQVAALRSWIVGRKGTAVPIVDRYGTETITYATGGYTFVVTQARVIEAKKLEAFHGYRLGTLYSYTPAVRVVSQWTMYAKSS